MKYNRKKLHDELTDGFIRHQIMVDRPSLEFPTIASMTLHYRTDSMFRARVDVLVSGVMQIIDENLEE
ncbi:MAG: hypothetical protein GY814_19245 [Gammaproteobacteria bacterium]|nr:hypothetical protein [Gammaproteobacteria bacterium]